MFYLLFSSLIWAFSYGIIKGGFVGISPDLVSFIRMMIPFLCFLPFLRLKKFSLRDGVSFFLIGMIQYGIMYLCVIRAYQYLSAYQVVLFTACTPIYVTLISDAFSKKFRPFYLLMAGIACLGSSILYYESFPLKDVLKGFFLVQASDFCFAFGQVAYKRFKEKKTYSNESVYALLFLGGAFITALSTSLLGGWNHVGILSLKQILILLYLGSIASGLCFFWWNRAAVKVFSGTLAVFNNAKIPLGVFVSILFFNEEADLRYVALSLALVGGSLLFSERYSRKKKEKDEKKSGAKQQTAYF